MSPRQRAQAKRWQHFSRRSTRSCGKALEGRLEDTTQIVYVSPLKALSNDIEKNLKAPLAGIREALRAQGLPDVEIRTLVRTGDTPQSERTKMHRQPPHILVTTPESLYILLTSESGRTMLSTARTVIVDEIHALAPNKRGAHLALSLERLTALCGDRLLRVGLSATQKPIEDIAHFLVGAGKPGLAGPGCKIIDTGHRRARDLAIELPPSPLEAVMAGEVREQVHDRLSELIDAHRTTLIFVNTRRLAERTARALSERLGTDQITAHHGSMSKEHRRDAEHRLKQGELKALVATASLELGIDIGDVDLVCQLGSPRSIASFLQRVGRSGHAVNGLPKGRLFPFSRDDLAECAALLDSVRRGELDRLDVQDQPLDVLAQQIVAEVAARDWNEDELLALLRRAWPYRNLTEADFSSVVTMLAEGFTTRRGRRGALIHHDAVNHRLRGRRGARLDGADLRRRNPGQRRLPGACSSRTISSSAACTRISPSKAWRAIFFNSAINPIASCGSSAALSASPMRMECRPRFRSGLAKRRAARRNSRSPSQDCGRRSQRCCRAMGQGMAQCNGFAKKPV